jgi:hypothetical protein
MVTAGTATIEVRDTVYQDTVRAQVLSSRARTNSVFDGIYKVRDHFESVWDPRRQASLRFTKRLNEGRYRQYRIHDYDPANHSTVYRSYFFRKGRFGTRKLTIPAGTQDILSAFYITRQSNLKVGQVLQFNVTVDAKSYKAEVIVHRRERIKTIFGKKDCLVIEPRLKGESLFKQTGAIYIWLTDDANKTPVRVESEIAFGKFSAVLTKAKNVP